MLAARTVPIVLLVASLASWPSGSAQTRPAAAATPIGHTALEDAYVWLAADLAAADAGHHRYAVPSTLPAAIGLCEKIHPDAADFSAAFFGLEAWSYSYVASQCFTHVAETVKDLALCDRVRGLDAPPPRAFLDADRNRPVTAEACREAVRAPGSGGVSGSYDVDLIVALLGYSRADIIAGSGGRPPEEGGALDFMLRVLPVPYDDSVDFYRIWNGHLARLARLPDFARGDAAARRQLDTLAPGWSSPSNTSDLARALRCSVERKPSSVSCP
jgi:hypothetical protein